MTTYAAFFRGINVGGNKKVPMADLQRVLANLGYENVRTLLASGNALFRAPESAAVVKRDIEAAFTKKFGFSSHVILRSAEELQKLADANPFNGIPVTPATRRYVTFFSAAPKSKMKTYESPDGNFRILRVSPTELCSVLIVTPESRSVDLMDIVEQEFGSDVTTRNWNTVEKILGLPHVNL